MKVSSNEKINTLIYYAIHPLAWIGIFLLFKWSFGLPGEMMPNTLQIKMAFTILLLVPVYYLNTQLLIPRLLFKKRIISYLLSLFALLVIAYQSHAYVSRVLDFESFLEEFEEVIDEYDERRMAEGEEFEEEDENEEIPLVLSIAALFLGGMLTFSKRHFKREKEQEEIKREQLNTELAFLKNQINPHFFFNTMNGIYSLIGKDPELAKENVHHLSKMMRYVLYGSNKETVSVNEEIEFLSNFIQLMEMRTHKSTEVRFDIADHINLEGQVAPLLLVPFVENAFKHGVSYAEPTKIEIKLAQEKDKLQLLVSNSIRNQKALEEEGGVGLVNVSKRLELLYKEGDYRLDISSLNNQYEVNLFIPIL